MSKTMSALTEDGARTEFASAEMLSTVDGFTARSAALRHELDEFQVISDCLRLLKGGNEHRRRREPGND